jgi:hypothetical protein
VAHAQHLGIEDVAHAAFGAGAANSA